MIGVVDACTNCYLTWLAIGELESLEARQSYRHLFRRRTANGVSSILNVVIAEVTVFIRHDCCGCYRRFRGGRCYLRVGCYLRCNCSLCGQCSLGNVICVIAVATRVFNMWILLTLLSVVVLLLWSLLTVEL